MVLKKETPLYQILNWNLHFENHKSRILLKCLYSLVPNNHGGNGWSNVMAESDGMAIYGAWMSILQVCSRQQPPRDGWLTVDGTKNGRRLSALELANQFRRPIEEIQRAIQVVTSPEVDFMRLIAGESDAYVTEGHQSGARGGVEGRQSGARGGVEGRQSGARGGVEGRQSGARGGVDRTAIDREIDRVLSKAASSNPESGKEKEAESAQPVRTDLIESGDEAKELFGQLCEKAFGFKQQPTQWPNDLEHALVAVLPIARADFELVDWFYSLELDHPIFGVTRRRQSFAPLIENLRSEIQKIRSSRKTIGLNGLHAETEPEEEWPAGTKEAAAALWGEGKLPPRFVDLPASARSDVTKKIAEAG